jgi:hypothetical protein
MKTKTLCQRALAMLIAGTSAGSSAIASNPTSEIVHHLSLRAYVDGKPVMDPTVGMSAAGPAEISLTNSNEDGYALSLEIQDAADGQSNRALHATLWQTSPQGGLRLHQQAFALGSGEEGATYGDTCASGEAGSQADGACIALMSHAVERSP